jgi:hypothetical protein
MTAWSRIAAVIVALVALLVSLRAATLWWRASNVETPNPPVASISDVPEQFIMATQSAASNAALLNARAAKWTGVAAVLSAAASIIGLL